jgi:predicted phosphate transport protein (TIGR00153 family)
MSVVAEIQESAMFGKLLPREGNFFEMFNQHADRIVEAARAFEQLVANYNDLHLREQYNRDVDNAERAADRVTHDVNRLIHKTFITPIDREQIHKLINTMDDVADLIQDSAETMALYDVRHMTEEITRLTTLSVKCCERVKDAVKFLGKITDPAIAEATLKTCEEIDRLESDADRVMRSAMSKLFREEPDVREVIKLKAIYELLETITDKCEDVANVIEGIVLENS